LSRTFEMTAARKDRYSFEASYDDPQAGIVREYVISFYEADNSVEMFDRKTKRCFLKKTVYPQAQKADFYIGNRVTINGRRLQLTDYADAATRRALQPSVEATLCIIKPDGYEVLGHIFQLLHNSGLTLAEANMVRLARNHVDELLRSHAGRISPEVLRSTAEFCSQYPVALLELRGEDAAARCRAALGPDAIASAKSAAPESLRSLFGKDDVANVAFCSPDATAAAAEVAYARLHGLTTGSVNNAALASCSVVLIKSHCLVSGAYGQIVQEILDSGLEVTCLGLRRFTTADAGDFLEVYRGVLPECEELVSDLATGTCLALEVRGEEVVPSVRALCGPYDPDIAQSLRPKTIRARFGVDRVRNAVHCTDLPEDGAGDSEFVFRLMRGANP